MSRERERGRAEEEEGADDQKHPALKNFNRTMFQAKHTLGKSLKYGAIAAAGGGVLVAGATTALGLTAAGGCAAAAVPTFGLSIPICAGLAYLGVSLGAGAGIASIAVRSLCIQGLPVRRSAACLA